MDKLTHIKPQNSPPTIGVVHSYETGPWYEIADTARQQGVNLIWFVGGVLRDPRGFAAHANVLYDLMKAETADGLVIWSGALDWFVDREEMESFCGRYHPLPVVSVETEIRGIPSVLTDNYQGVHDVVAHLIEIHGYRRIAFMRGPEGHSGAQERYRAYVETLAEYGLSPDPNLSTPPGAWTPGEGTAMINLLLDEQGVDFEAVVAVNDTMAFEALAELQARGVQVPSDIAVVGFDDEVGARAVTPPLTTVRQPFYEAAQQAVELVLAQLRGEQVPERVVVPTRLVVRQSCGCSSPAVMQAAAGSVTGVGKPFEMALAERQEHILSGMVQAMGSSAAGLDPRWAEQLMDAFTVELKGESPGTLLPTLNHIMRKAVAAGGDATAWQGVISALRRDVLPCLGDGEALSQAEDLWGQSRVMIAETEQLACANQRLRAEQHAQTLREIGQALITAFDVTELMDVMARELPRLGIPSCYLALYEGQEVPATRSSLVLAYDEKGRVKLETGGRSFLSRQLVPTGLLPHDRCYMMVVEPLYFREDQLGFALFEVGPREGSVYETLRGQISSALKGALLLQERKQAEETLEKAYAEVEKQVEERTTELKREVAERERLQQEIIEAQRLAIQELSTPVIPIMERIIVMPLVGSIDTLRARDITRALLAGIRQHRARVVILDITGVPVVDSGVADYLNKTVQAARLKGARTIVTGISDAVAETIVDLGIDWSGIETVANLQAGLQAALLKMGRRIEG